MECIDEVVAWFIRCSWIGAKWLWIYGCESYRGAKNNFEIEEEILQGTSLYLTWCWFKPLWKDFIVLSIQEAKDVKDMKIEELQSSFEAHEMLVIERGSGRSLQQEMQAHFTKRDGYEKYLKNKGKEKFKKGNW